MSLIIYAGYWTIETIDFQLKIPERKNPRATKYFREFLFYLEIGYMNRKIMLAH